MDSKWMLKNTEKKDEKLQWNLRSAIAVAMDLTYLLWNLFLAFAEPLYRLLVPKQLKNLDYEVILVTGAGNGMGKEICLYLGETCPQSILVLWDINKRDNDNVCAQLQSLGITAHAYQVDISSREKVRAAAEQVRRDVGNVSIIINNAGIMPPSQYFWDMNAGAMEKIYQINVLSHYWILGEFLPQMMEKNHGHVVALSSMAGVIPNECSSVYCGSKYAVRGFMDSLRMELRSKKININCSTVFPAMVGTNLLGPVQLVCKYPPPMATVGPREAAITIVDGFRKDVDNIFVPDKRVWIFALIKTLLPQRAVLAFDDVFNYHLETKEGFVPPTQQEVGGGSAPNNAGVLGNGSAKTGTEPASEIPSPVIQQEMELEVEIENKEVENILEGNNMQQVLEQPLLHPPGHRRKQARKGNA